ncbi:MAG: hypothetical protein AAF662_05865 [Pseudomonadota bacterium]
MPLAESAMEVPPNKAMKRALPVLIALLVSFVCPRGLAQSLPTIDDVFSGELPPGWAITVFGGEGTPEKGELLFSVNISTEPFNLIGYATWGDVVRIPKDAVQIDHTSDYSLYSFEDSTGASFFYLRRGPAYSIVIRVSDTNVRAGMRVIAAFASIEVK